MKGYIIIGKDIYRNTTSNRGISVLFQRSFTNADIPPFSYIGVGLGATPPDENDSALEYEIGRKEAVYNHISPSRSIVLSTTFPKGEIEGLISEIGIFNKSHAGDMFARALISPPKWKERNKSFPVAWKFSL
jgi:hypothetical protein